jgi:signal peptidase I
VFIAFTLRSTVAMTVHVVGESVTPELPSGSYAMVNRLANDYVPGDIVVFKSDGVFKLARVEAQVDQTVTLVRNQVEAFDMPTDLITGRVWWGTR